MRAGTTIAVAALLATAAQATVGLDAPSEVAATAPTPFTARITWTDRSAGERGFLVEERRAGGRWRAVAIAARDGAAITLHARWPDTAYAYRVRAFADALAEPSAETTVRTPPLPAEAPAERAGPCTSFDAMSRDAVAWRVLLRGARMLDLRERPRPDDAGDATTWELFGDDRGCYRRLGTARMRWPPYDVIEAMPTTSGGWPLLVTSTGEDPAQVEVHQLVGGAFAVVDSFPTCDERTRWNDAAPPAASNSLPCQYLPSRY